MVFLRIPHYLRQDMFSRPDDIHHWIIETLEHVNVEILVTAFEVSLMRFLVAM